MVNSEMKKRKIFTIKVFDVYTGSRTFDDDGAPIADYLYCIFIFGILIHSVRIGAMSKHKIRSVVGYNIELIER